MLKHALHKKFIAQIHVVSILQVVQRQFGQMRLGEWRSRFAHGHVAAIPRQVGTALANVVRGLVIAVVGIHLHRRHRIEFADGVESHHAVALVEVLALRRCSAVEATEEAGGRGADGIATEMVKHVSTSEVLVVASLQRADGLELVGEHHACYAEKKPHPRRPSPYSRFFLSERLELSLLAQFDVHRHLVARYVLLHASAVVVAHDFHVRHVVRRDVPRCQVIFATQQVQTLDVELRDGLAHVADGTTLRHIHTWQAFQSVLQGHVALAEERCEVVAQRVAILSQWFCFHHHFLQRDAFRSQHPVNPRLFLIQH